MKRLGLACALAVLTPGGLWAQNAAGYGMGVGIVLGSPTGVTAKYYMSDVRAVDFGVGESEHVTVYGDYLWHGWSVFPQPREGRLGGYLGLGGRVEAHDDPAVGIRTVAGMSYFLAGYPVEVFAEIVPVFELTPDSEVDLDGGIGIRYYFGKKVL